MGFEPYPASNNPLQSPSFRLDALSFFHKRNTVNLIRKVNVTNDALSICNVRNPEAVAVSYGS